MMHLQKFQQVELFNKKPNEFDINNVIAYLK
jgi:hypothetical protein